MQPTIEWDNFVLGMVLILLTLLGCIATYRGNRLLAQEMAMDYNWKQAMADSMIPALVGGWALTNLEISNVFPFSTLAWKTIGVIHAVFCFWVLSFVIRRQTTQLRYHQWKADQWKAKAKPVGSIFEA